MRLGERGVALLVAAGLDPATVETVVGSALTEDLDGGADVTTEATVAADHVSGAKFVSRAAGVAAGLPVAFAVLDLAHTLLDRVNARPAVDLLVSDGDRVTPGQSLLQVRGATRTLLTAERTALNLLGMLSGVATLTRQWVDAVAGTGAVIRDTRKTAPGLRALQKYAVRAGGGRNHRMSLVDAALIKDNHLLAAGGIAAAFAAVRSARPNLDIEVECDTVRQVREAVAAGAGLVLLDNMPPAMLREAVVAARRLTPGVRLEASGGLTLANAREVAGTGVDFLAVGALTHSAASLDIGLDLEN